MKYPGWHKSVLWADSMEILKRIPDNSVDFILTDPPYNIGQHSTGNIPLQGRAAMNNDVAEWDLVPFNPEEWSEEFIRILKPEGNLFIFTSYNQIGRWYNCLDHRFDTTNFMIWHKTNPAPKVFKAGFLNSCEMIFTCWNKGHTWHFSSQSEMHNFIESPICMRPERLSEPKHPTQKPISILKRMIEIATNEGDIIFDPFMGVGSVGVAAIQLKRRYIGVEIDEAYYRAAKKRIDETLEITKKEFTMEQNDNNDNEVCDVAVAYQTYPYQLELFSWDKEKTAGGDISTGLSPIIKWPGGKEKELKYIIPNMPSFERFFEPFVGGGSVFMGINAKEYYINDFSKELIDLYRCISTQNSNFFKYVGSIDMSWNNSRAFFQSHLEIVGAYKDYQNSLVSELELKHFVKSFCEINSKEIKELVGSEFSEFEMVIVNEMETNLFRKMIRMRQLEKQKHQLPEKDLFDNIETAIKSAVYMNYRYLYNSKHIEQTNPILHCALFFFIRNYAYSGMFRYSSKGDFNVPYGGIAYNSKNLSKKLLYYKSKELLRHFDRTQIFNLDFEEFLDRQSLSENDFIFLDPPYDTEFSTYAKNEFTKDDQIRLANYLLNRCKAKWMMIIKYTDFIHSLYDKPGISIKTFDKEYVVSFMNRNDKKVTHLLITNY